MIDPKLSNEIEIPDLHDAEFSQRFLLFYLFETWEKLIQVKTFVNSREHRRSRRKWAVIQNFNDVIDHLAKQLDVSAVPYAIGLLEGNAFVLDELAVTVRSIKQVLDALLHLHQKLNFLAGSGKGENQITYDFVRKLAADTSDESPESGSWLPHIPAITLTDDYTFREYDLRSILSSELEETGFKALSSGDRDVVLALPKLEADNPLMWSILAHETAHTMISHYRILEEIVKSELAFRKADKSTQQEYMNWSREICADLIAMQLLGPAYFFSFASMDLLLDLSPYSTSHPPTIDRTGTLARVLSKYHPEWIIESPNTDSNLFSREHLIPFFYRMVSYKHQLWSSYPRYFPFIRESAGDSPLTPKRDLIMNVLARVHVPVTDIASSSWLGSFYNLLVTGQPVASMPSDFNKETFQSALYAVQDAETFYSILPKPDKALALSTILACGWMFKVYFNYSELFAQMAKSGSVWKNMETYSKTLTRRNELLQSSISRAYIMQIYWRWRDRVGKNTDK